MAKETKIGLALCLLLIAAFAFVVYSKMERQKLDDEFIAGSDSTNPPAPTPEANSKHLDFGGEPDIGHDHAHHEGHDHDQADHDDGHGVIHDLAQRNSPDHAGHDHAGHHHAGHDHGNTLKGDGDAPVDPFAVTRHKGHEHHETRRHRFQQEPADAPWATADTNRGQSREADPFSPASHRHSRGDAPAPDEAGQSEPFGLDEPEPVRKRPKTIGIADFLDGRGEQSTARKRPAAPAPDEENPFGLEPERTAKVQQPAPTDGGFNPFADAPAPAPDANTEHQFHDSLVNDDRHAHTHAHESGHEHGHGHEHAHAAGSDSGSNEWSSGQFHTEVQPADAGEASNEFGLVDSDEQADTAPPPQDLAGDAPFGSRRRFGAGRPAPAPDERWNHKDFGAPQPHEHEHEHEHEQGDSGHLLPVAGGDDRPEIHVVARGDNFWNISKKQYGAGRYYKALARYNKRRIPDPEKMRPGMKVLVPTTDILVSRFPALCPWHAAQPAAGQPGGGHRQAGFFTSASGEPRYCVGADDTLTGISRKLLGRASRWVQLYALNRDVIPDPGKLKIGTILRLPADASHVELVRRGQTVR